MNLGTILLSFILWDVPPEIFPGTSIPLRWYGFLFAMAFLAGQYIILHIFRAEGKPDKDVDALTYYMIGATIIGARLGHCLFYQPEIYLPDPIQILKIWEGGLASHGAAVGIILAMWLYARKRPDQSWLWILDRIVILVALGGSFIRMGNLMNSEILGKASDQPWAMVFVQAFNNALQETEGKRIKSIEWAHASGPDTLIQGQKMVPVKLNLVFENDLMQGSSGEAFIYSTLPALVEVSNKEETHLYYQPALARAVQGYDAKGRKTMEIRMWGLPRHPAMVYEAISTFLLFVGLFLYWKRNVGQVPEGRLFAVFVVVLFSLRFLYEFLKENQVDFESRLPFNMGQNLSIPLVMFGCWLLYKSFRKKEVL
jgi:prolipoprotein diacylglyceryl transferase